MMVRIRTPPFYLPRCGRGARTRGPASSFLMKRSGAEGDRPLSAADRVRLSPPANSAAYSAIFIFGREPCRSFVGAGSADLRAAAKDLVCEFAAGTAIVWKPPPRIKVSKAGSARRKTARVEDPGAYSDGQWPTSSTTSPCRERGGCRRPLCAHRMPSGHHASTRARTRATRRAAVSPLDD